MSRNISGIVAGVGLGLAVGGAGLALGKTMMSPNPKKMLKKKAAKSLKTMETLLDDIQYMFK
ncbi:MAG: hypothetical protein E7558_05845 [Ruminococcaceae bacterium]|nr:hypothetical protein [Oscillospiraceae bacterium]MBQ6872715.1 hypothetical protein [Clostridia bacterium]